MKKLVAIVLSVAMLVSCVPMIAFADPAEPPEDKTPEEQFIDNTEQELHDLLIRALGSDEAKAFLDAYLKQSEEFQKYKDLVDEFAKAIKDNPENVDKYLEYLDEYLKPYIQELKARAEELQDDPKVQAAIDRLVEELNALDTFLEEHDYHTEKYFPDSLFDIDEKIQEAYDDLKEIVDKEFVVDCLNYLVDRAFIIAEENGADPEKLEEIYQNLLDLQAVIEYYASMDKDEAIDALIHDAYEQLLIVADKALDKAVDQIEKYMDAHGISDEQFYELLDQLRSVQGVIDKIGELVDEVRNFDYDSIDLEEIIERAESVMKEFIEQHKAEVKEALDKLIEKAEEQIDAIKDTKSFKELIKLMNQIQDYIDCIKQIDPDELIDKIITETKAALQELVQKSLEDLEALTKAELEKLGITEEDIQELIEKAKEIQECIKAYIDIYKDMDYCKMIEDLINEIQETVDETMREAMRYLIDEAKEILEKQKVITKEVLQKLYAILDKIQEIVDEYKDLEPSELMQKLIQEAKDLFDKYQDKIMEAALNAASEFLEKLHNGDFDKYLKPIGMTAEELERLVADLIAYGFGLANGEGYLDLQEKLASALFELEELTYDLEELKDDNADLTQRLADKVSELEILNEQFTRLQGQYDTAQTTITDLQKQVAEAADDKEIIKKFINGYNVSKKKPTLKKVKAIKGKKVKVTFKGLKKLNVSKYQINYKTGKKAKNKTWKKKTSSAKTLNYTLKKLKKGKKYTIKVRAIYQFKYKGKTYKFVSKWSKAKKVKKVK